MENKNKKRLLEAEDLCRLNLPSDIAFSPDETKVAYTVENISEDRQKYFSRIFVVDIKTGRSQQYTYGEISDRALSWSPDSKWLAFVSTREKKTGVYLIPAEGGAERKIIEEDGSFSRPLWTPDCKELVFAFRFNDSHAEKDEKKKKEAPVFRHITKLFYRLDGSGFLPKGTFHIWKLDIASGKMKQLTRGKYNDIQPDISRDGKWVVFISNHSVEPDRFINNEELFMVPTAGGKLKKIPTPLGPKASPAFSPDGKMIAYAGNDNPEDTMGVTNFHIWIVGVTGKPAARDLIPRFDRSCIDLTICDTVEGHGVVPPAWSSDGKKLYFAASDTGSTHLFHISAKGGLPTRITKKPCHIKNHSVARSGKKIAAIIADIDDPGNIFLLPAAYNGDGKRNQLTHLNTPLFSQIDFPKTQEKWFKGFDGTELQGWLVTPPNFNRNRKYPAILEIHGGPRVQYGHSFFHEMLFLASKGYIIFYTNPRGGGGRGETWAAANVADWGGIDYMDCMAATDYMEKLPFVNKKKMGVTGGSYGGYMTNWIVGHTPRFKAAVTQRSVVNLESFFGSSDFGYLDKAEFGGQPWETPDEHKRMSPLTYARNIKTPLLILHNESDLRCGIEQAEQLFATLKYLRKKVEFVRFPEEPHGLSRHGRPDRRIARLQWILKWFDRYLKR
jgi:dipeptidyl aminopeptidase/acylaminoacyl peptidase